MTRQPDLFQPWHDEQGAQLDLFELDGPAETGLSCQCGEPLVRTPSGYLACPRGHGRLIPEGREDTAALFDTPE